jgi:hypothetical protein
MLTITGDYDGLVERTNHQATSQEILQVIADHPKLVECVDQIMPLKKNYITSETKHLMCWIICVGMLIIVLIWLMNS